MIAQARKAVESADSEILSYLRSPFVVDHTTPDAVCEIAGAITDTIDLGDVDWNLELRSWAVEKITADGLGFPYEHWARASRRWLDAKSKVEAPAGGRPRTPHR